MWNYDVEPVSSATLEQAHECFSCWCFTELHPKCHAAKEGRAQSECDESERTGFDEGSTLHEELPPLKFG
jgi:hypothetical protein